MTYATLKSPFSFETYRHIMLVPSAKVQQKFEENRNVISAILSQDLVDTLATEPFMQEILEYSHERGTLKNSHFTFAANKCPSFLKAEENHATILVYKLVGSFWYRKELGEAYLKKRDSLFTLLNLDRALFLKLECFQTFRDRLLTLPSAESIRQYGQRLKTAESEALSKNDIQKMIAL